MGMRQSLGQQQRQVQKQVLKLRMIQSMELLQLPIQQLQERIQEELQENPVLELRQEEWTEEPPESEGETKPISVDEKEIVIGRGDEKDDFERLDNMREEISDYQEENSRPSRAALEEAAERHTDVMANVPSRSQTLQDALSEQLRWLDLDKALRDAVEILVYSLDSHGFLLEPLEVLFEKEPTLLPLAEKALQVLQKMDPPGVGAKDWKDSLLLQLEPEEEHYRELRLLITRYLEDVGHNRVPYVLKVTGWTKEFLDTLMRRIRGLNPDPGRDYRQDVASTIVPDIYCFRLENGNYRVVLEESEIPALMVNGDYQHWIHDRDVPSQTREYLRQKFSAAKWLMEAIEQRQTTLLRVAQAIVDYQKAFLEQGEEALRPLKMQQIADELQIHVTTVSRAVDDKWMQTPRGILPLRKFFVSGVATTQQSGEAGEDVSRNTIQAKIREWIEKEDRTQPLSDEKITQRLAEAGFPIQRRTVVKYRQEMNIPSSRMRRVYPS